MKKKNIDFPHELAPCYASSHSHHHHPHELAPSYASSHPHHHQSHELAPSYASSRSHHYKFFFHAVCVSVAAAASAVAADFPAAF
jgi:hypothetical protein